MNTDKNQTNQSQTQSKAQTGTNNTPRMNTTGGTSSAHLTQPKKKFTFDAFMGKDQPQTSSTATDSKQEKTAEPRFTPPAPVNKFKGTGEAYQTPSQPPQPEPKTEEKTSNKESKPLKTFKKGDARKKKNMMLLLGFVILLIAGGGLFYVLKILPEKDVPTEPISVPVAEVEDPCTVVLTVPSPEIEPTATPTAPAATATPTGTIIPTTTPTVTLTPTVTTTPTTTPTVTVTPTATTTPTTTPTATVTPTATTTPTTTPALTLTPTATIEPGTTVTPTATTAPGVTTAPTTTTAPTATTAPTTAIAQATQPPYTTPLPTEPGQPQKYVVDTQAQCNEACATNADCANISHICYNGVCRLDINPEDELCRTPEGERYVERVVEQPVAGPREWLNYLKIGISIIGAGLLLLLFL